MQRKKMRGHKKTALLLAALLMILPVLSSCGEEEATSGSNTTKAGLEMSVNKATGNMDIKRPELAAAAPMGDEGTWTIFVYMCGSDLESRLLFGGLATKDIKEMRKASASDNVRFVVECGGSTLWHSLDITGDPDERFVIEDGELIKAGDSSKSNMGKSGTLTSFLKWGVKNYPADKMGVIFWDHGGGSISGVCFDQNHDDNPLTLREIDASLLSVMENMTDKFEFIGFDACLMGTVEMANIAASYARYMYGSQESEPGTGWDYKAIGNYLAKHPDADGGDLGKVVCDSFQKSIDDEEDSAIVTMSVIDLTKMDTLIKKFNTFAREMFNAAKDESTMNSMVRKINKAENFGGNDRTEGYTNMVDLGGLTSACKKWTDSAEKVVKAIDKAVVYQVSGSDHKKASGLSVYFPLAVQTSDELSVFNSICVSPYYLSFVDKQGHSSVEHEYYEDYDDDTWFIDGVWNWIDEFLYDEDSGDYDYECDEEYYDYWSFLDGFSATGASALITFEEEPGMSEDGDFCFILDDEGYENTQDVSALVYQYADDGESLIELGETLDIYSDWDEGIFMDNFDGYWLSLPDGQNLALYVVDRTDDYDIYTSPILLNNEETNLRMRQYNDGSVKIEGAWDGIDENGAASRNVIKLQKGDVIVPTYYSVDEDGNDIGEYEGEAYTVGDSTEIDYDLLYEGDYAYAFCIDDVYGDYYISDLAEFRVDDSGVSFYD